MSSKFFLSFTVYAIIFYSCFIISASFKIYKSNSRVKGITPIKMHLHNNIMDSYQHHDHSHDHTMDISNAGEQREKESPLSQFGSFLLNQRIRRRPIVRTLFAFFLVLFPAIIRRRISSMDFIIFGLTWTTLNIYDSGRSVIKGWMARMKLFQNNLIKHSTPLTRKYFFKNENAADRITFLGVWINIVLSISKFVGGVKFNSAVLVADAGHSLSDLLSDFITLWAVQIARLPPDDDHPYGHGKFEAVGSLFLSITLVLTGLSIGTWSYDKMRSILLTQFLSLSTKTSATKLSAALLTSYEVPSWPALLLAALSIASKEWLFRITKRVGTALNSQILIANAWHHRSDAFSSILSLVSIGIAITFPSLIFFDSAGGILVAGMICLTGFEVMSESIKQLTDTLDVDLVDKISTLSLDVRGVLGVSNIRARSVGSGSLVDMTVLTDHQIPASKVQDIMENVRWKIVGTLPQVTDVLVHSSAVETYCPLLAKKYQRTLSEVEQEVKLILSDHKGVKDVKRVTVHHINTALICVEGVISVDSQLQVQQAQQIAQELQSQIKTRAGIDVSTIQLDLSGAL